MSLLVVGSVAIDSVETPFGKKEKVLGGSATYFSISASLFTKVRLVAVVGRDFPERYLNVLKGRGISLEGLEITGGRTFRWKGKYAYDLNSANTIYTKLNVFKTFSPKIPVSYKRTPYLFLANIDPELQLNVLKNIFPPRLVACDSMNFWILNKLPALKKLLRHMDVFIINDSEARLLSNESNLIKAARYIFALGPKRLIIKRGDSGALFFKNAATCLNTPAYLLEDLKDPTGAGDSFAGGFMGYLSRANEVNDRTMVRAVTYGTITASFCVQDFGPERLVRLRLADIEKRVHAYRKSICP